MSNESNLIPNGSYCYTYIDGKYSVCPFWGLDKSKPYQENGFCTFLNRCDWDLGACSLLWDQCKECGINND